ncbi:MAG TPA: ATP-binding domain-containing protein, partial [Exilispira sp.]|nr:ATP-binding domain-containing protein [Exilispira sp.]
LAYFLTVHKSQGSEYDNIVLILPEDSKNIEIIGLQMIYTALTRAKKDVYIFSDEESLLFALSKRVRRTTGLFQKI